MFISINCTPAYTFKTYLRMPTRMHTLPECRDKRRKSRTLTLIPPSGTKSAFSPPMSAERMTEWINGWKPGWYWNNVLSHSVMSDSLQPQGPQVARLHSPWDFLGKNSGGGYHFLLQGIFLTQGSNPQLCVSCIGRSILDHKHHLGNMNSGRNFVSRDTYQSAPHNCLS